MTSKEDKWNDVVAAEAAERVAADREELGNRNLLAWLRRSPQHVAEYLSVTKLSDEVARVARNIDIPVETLAAEITGSDKIVEIAVRDLRATAAPPESASWPQIAGAMFGVAAVLALIIGAGFLWNSFSQINTDRYSTGHGEERTVRLSDGTFIHLNTDSAVSATFDGRARLVSLDQGEAYFEVAKNPGRPFRVGVGTAVLQDFGTAFDAFRDRGKTIVTVVEGRVGVFKPANGSGENAPVPGRRLADLRAGEQVTLSRSGAIESQARPDLNQILAWTREQIVFDHQTIAEVAAQFNRYNDVPIVVDDPRLAAVEISGTFYVHAEMSFVRFLDGLPGVKAMQQGSAIMVATKVAHRSIGKGTSRRQ